MTPRELYLRAKVYTERREAEVTELRMQAYLTAALTAAFVKTRSGSIPEFEDCFAEKDKEMSDDEMLSTVRALNAQMGGTDILKEREDPADPESPS